MTVPTFANILPKAGPTRARRLVQILGSGFQMPPAPAATGKTTTPNPSVRVLFGTVPSDDVGVVTEGMLHVLTPIHDQGAVDITIQNIDQQGNVVAGEQVTATAAYTYARPNLNAREANESLLAYVVRTLLQEMKRQILENVELTTNVDFDDSPTDMANIAALASLPGLVLAGPQLRENRLYGLNELREDVDLEFIQQAQLRPGYTVDLVFTVIGVDDTAQRHLNLMQETIGFFHQNQLLVVPDPVDPTQFVEFEMLIETPPSIVGGPNNSNLRAFSGTVAVLGVTLDDDDMAIRAIFEVQDVVPTGGGVNAPSAVILTGTPGTFPAPPVAPNPPAQPGKRFSIEQFLADQDEE